jgi:hypothetical protein
MCAQQEMSSWFSSHCRSIASHPMTALAIISLGNDVAAFKHQRPQLLTFY